ncbi:heterokaryon incompatibility [Fusarium longipes]|uniref:Heterokaryon incompatibility n=1 Tax=Fusarium longipes TaxID=694270 RepID=A0A395SBW6_9HYPO|nr:heterokaryon incompatibility [Fusarium longipes]
MQLRLEPHFSYGREYHKGWREFIGSDYVSYFFHEKPRSADCKPGDFLIPYHKTVEDLYQASEECDVCRALLHSAMDIVRLRTSLTNVSWAHGPSGQGLFLCGLGRGQGIQLMALDDSNSDSTYALLGAVGFYVNKGKHQLEEGMPIEAFPKTFNDAFWLIHQLEIPYIWIDSLCILQDDNDDWVHESARMCDVYGNAYLTIAATRAGNCSEGFVGSREGPGYGYIPFHQDGMFDHVAVSPLPVRHVEPWSRIIDLEEEPLSKRAWTLQERYLSPRTVHFASAQMYFECRSGFHAQDNHMKQKYNEEDFKIHRRVTEKHDDEPRDAWDSIVRRYTERHLTVESDKLPAIGGLAARVFLERDLDNGPSEEYLAGLWRKDLIWNLTWMIDIANELRSVPEHYTAPSWSWASINHPVYFHGPEDDQHLAIVKDAKVDLQNPDNPFGHVTGGWIHLSCVKLHPCDMDTKFDALYLGAGDVRFRTSIFLDPPRFGLPAIRLADYVDNKLDLVAVPLTSYFDIAMPEYEDGKDTVESIHFLILVPSKSLADPVQGLPHYRRVGLGLAVQEDNDDSDVADARRQMRDKCLAAMEEGTLEDIMIV